MATKKDQTGPTSANSEQNSPELPNDPYNPKVSPPPPRDPAWNDPNHDPHHTPAGVGDPRDPSLFTYSNEASMTEQERDTDSPLPGVGPVGVSRSSPGPVETIEDQGIGPRTPYPTGDPPAGLLRTGDPNAPNDLDDAGPSAHGPQPVKDDPGSDPDLKGKTRTPGKPLTTPDPE